MNISIINRFLSISLVFNLIAIILIFLNFIKIPVFDLTRYRGNIFNKDGYFLGNFKIKAKNKIQKTKWGYYNFLANHISYSLFTFLFWRSKHFYYELNNPDPLVIRTNIKPYLDSKVYEDIIEADHISKISKDAKRGLLSALLTPRNILLVLIVIAVIWYIASGGKLS